MYMVSIIVPVYNAEQYLIDCVRSLIGQTYEKIEIILIDDGSTDRSSEICDMCIGLDSRIKVYHQKNKGVSSARNFGIDVAKGDFVCFVDADDLIRSRMIEILLEGLIEENTDIAVCGYTAVTDRKRFIENSITPSKEKNFRLNSEEALKALFETNVAGFLWNKIYRIGMLKSEKLNENLRICEDLEYNFRLIYKQKATLCYIETQLYGYYNNNFSTSKMNLVGKDHVMVFEPAYDTMISLVQDNKDKEMQVFVSNKKTGMELLSFLNLYQVSQEAYYLYRKKFIRTGVILPRTGILTARQWFLVWCEMIWHNSARKLMNVWRKMND